MSFIRIIPKLLSKVATLGAFAGGAMVASLTYIQYQATQAGNYAIDVVNRARDQVTAATDSLYGSANGLFDQAINRWEMKKEQDLFPRWLQKLLERNDDSSGYTNGSNPNGSSQKGKATTLSAVAGTVAALGADDESSGESHQDQMMAKDDQMMLLTKKMIQIRSLLQTVGQSDALTLPSIVVIGSQSSGKSSVLEAIVGHEFLPKGPNMMTRRPIELTLVNTPNSSSEYGEFPELGLGKISDFHQIQRTLTDLNFAVPTSDCVTDDPIFLRIYSPNVPDLSLIDLPGFIQVTGRDQPLELKQKIAALCNKYIQPPNVILAISAADVDMANSTALRASRTVDPRGERTIGVITKLDLVDPERARSILTDKKFALRLGYVGVVCRIPTSTHTLFHRGSGNISNAIARNESAYFSAHPSVFNTEAQDGIEVGTQTLRKKLMLVLESTMAASMKTTAEAVSSDLAETSYEFKVQYNGRPLSAESYLAESLDTFKHGFKSFSDKFGRSELRELIKQELDQQVLNLLAQRYWNQPIGDLSMPPEDENPLRDLPRADPENPLWHLKLDASSASLTKLGIGRLATRVVAAELQGQIEWLIRGSPFAAHPLAKEAITEAAMNILRNLAYEISDELEICIKPYKYRIETEGNEWMRARENITGVLKEELRVCEGAIKVVEADVGGKKRLRDVIGFVDRVRSGQAVLEGDGGGGAGGFSAALLKKGREAVFLRDRADILKMRLVAIKSKQCMAASNKYYCPEVFLDLVADKLTTTADLFLDAELLSKFYYLFPRELDARLGRGLAREEVEAFAREDSKIRRHLDVVRRKDLLEHVLAEMDALRQLEAMEKRNNSDNLLGRQEKSVKRDSGKKTLGLF